MTVVNRNLFATVLVLDNTAKIPALRGIAHSAMAKCIGAIRQHLREETRQQRDEERNTGLDDRTEKEQRFSSFEDMANAMGFQKNTTALQQAALLHGVYKWAVDQLGTLITNQWDEPLSLEGMLKFMTTGARPLDDTLVKALADIIKTDEATIRKLHEVQSRMDQEKLKELLPTIVLTFNGFNSPVTATMDEAGYIDEADTRDPGEDYITRLPPVIQHQLGVKVVEDLRKARDRTLVRVLQRRKLDDLGSIPIIEDATTQMKNWVTEFEAAHKADIEEAIERGITMRSVEDALKTSV